MGTPPQPPQPPQPPPPVQPPPGPPPQQQGAPGMAIAGFVVGLIGLLAFWFAVGGLVISIVGLVLSIVGRRQAIERGAPTGLATAGLVCSIIGIAAGLIFTILVIAILDEADDTFDDLTFTTTTFNLVIGWRMLTKKLPPLRRLRG